MTTETIMENPVSKTTPAMEIPVFVPAATQPEPPPAAEQPPPPPAPSAVQFATIDAPTVVDPTLLRILGWRRRHDTKHEIQFTSWLHDELRARGVTPTVMGKGNVVVDIPFPDGKRSTTLFSCHVDTVHASSKEPTQALVYDATFGHIFLDKAKHGNGDCLGADDGAGVWLLLELIKGKVPGSYIFHRGEECGGIGASSMLESHREWLEQFDAAVAFDRKDTVDLITHQGGLRCASDKFAEALCKALNDAGGFAYKPCTGGTFTDVKLYRGVISECVNISVGYDFQHTPDETLDYAHIVRLRDAALKVSWETLPAERDPKVIEQSKYYAPPKYYKPPFQGARAGAWDEMERAHQAQIDMWSKYPTTPSKKGGKKKSAIRSAPPRAADTAPPPGKFEPALRPEDHFRDTGIDGIIDLFDSDPRETALLVLELAAETAALRAEVNFWKGAAQ